MKTNQFTVRLTPPGSTLPEHRAVVARSPQQALNSCLPAEDVGILFDAKPGTTSRPFVSADGFSGEVAPHVPTPVL